MDITRLMNDATIRVIAETLKNIFLIIFYPHLFRFFCPGVAMLPLQDVYLEI